MFSTFKRSMFFAAIVALAFMGTFFTATAHATLPVGAQKHKLEADFCVAGEATANSVSGKCYSRSGTYTNLALCEQRMKDYVQQDFHFFVPTVVVKNTDWEWNDKTTNSSENVNKTVIGGRLPVTPQLPAQ